MSASAFCPNCGAPFTFHIASSVVTVCESCSTVLARTDRAFEDLGKTSDLVQTQSPLALWVNGSYQGVGFQLTGRTQLRHGAGGVWDEWYLAFDNGHWGWLAEAQGKFYLTFRQPQAAAPGQILDPRAIGPGQWIQVGDPPAAMAVAEVGEAQTLGGRGEIPYRLETGKRYRYADLSGPGGAFGTLDFGDQPPALFLGREVTLHELGLATAPTPERIPGIDVDPAHPPVKVQAVTCDNCGGSLELRAPDVTERVACPYCGAMHNCNRGVLRFLKAVKAPAVKPGIPLGSQGTFEGETLTVIGFMVRSVRAYGQRYEWSEYLLYHPRVGFRWLVHADGHYTYVSPLPPGDVHARRPDQRHLRGDTARHDGVSYTVFARGTARVDRVAGEFYWKVTVGEHVETVDYVKPPHVLSGEMSGGEIHWSRGVYITPRELRSRFPGVELPPDTRSGVAPAQPFRHGAVYPVWGVLFALAVAAMVWSQARHKRHVVLSQTLQIAPRTAGSAPPAGAAGQPGTALGPDDPDVFFTEPFELAGGVNNQFRATASKLANSWIYVECDLYNEDTGRVVPFALPVEFYFGTSGGESWTEGGRSASAYLSAVPAGRYVLRVSVLRDKNRLDKPDTLQIALTQGVFRWRYWLIALLLLSIIPAGVLVYHRSFEHRRWSQSDFAPDDDD